MAIEDEKEVTDNDENDRYRFGNGKEVSALQK